MKCRMCGETPKIVQTSRRKTTGLTRGLCTGCYSKAHRDGTLEDYALPAVGYQGVPIGTRIVDSKGYVKEKTETGMEHEHRLVMERSLGRKLVRGENVHHVNGVRDDNRLSNLELWFIPQPKGQRVEEILAYVVEQHAEQLEELLEARRGA